MRTDSTIVPPKKNSDVPYRTFHGCSRHEEGCYEKNAFAYFLVCEGVSNDDVGVARVHRISGERYDRMLVSKTGDFVREKLGGLP